MGPCTTFHPCTTIFNRHLLSSDRKPTTGEIKENERSSVASNNLYGLVQEKVKAAIIIENDQNYPKRKKWMLWENRGKMKQALRRDIV